MQTSRKRKCNCLFSPFPYVINSSISGWLTWVSYGHEKGNDWFLGCSCISQCHGLLFALEANSSSSRKEWLLQTVSIYNTLAFRHVSSGQLIKDGEFPLYSGQLVTFHNRTASVWKAQTNKIPLRIEEFPRSWQNSALITEPQSHDAANRCQGTADVLTGQVSAQSHASLFHQSSLHRTNSEMKLLRIPSWWQPSIKATARHIWVEGSI